MIDEQQTVKMVDDAMVSAGNSRDKLLAATKLLKVMSSVDALVVFSMAKDGIEADTRTYSKIGLTRKKYYTRLRQLKNAGLIEKKGKLYSQTTMGSFLHENCINPVAHAIRNSKEMAMIDALKSVRKFSDEDLLKAKNSIFRIPSGGTD